MHALIVVAHHHPRSSPTPSPRASPKAWSAPVIPRKPPTWRRKASSRASAPADHAVHRGQASPPADVLAEQARIDRADTLVLVYPIYWWSMPALLKGWIDRVFSMAGPSTTASAATCGKAAAPARGAGRCRRRRCRHLRAARLRRGDAHQIDHGIFRLLRRTGGPFLNCCWSRRAPIRSGIWTRPCTSAASSSPHAARRGRPGAAAGGLTPGHSARCMAKPARCGASSSRRVSAGIR